MSKVAAILENDEVTETATDHLAKLRVDDLTWELLSEEGEVERILPAFVWPSGNTAQVSGVAAPLGAVVQADYPEEETLENKGADGSVADYYALSIARGATVIIVDAPHDYREQVRSTLADAGATRITWE
ncbi:MAG: hypothetical protein KF832_08090 [Caldilineaceae bacterium]|nr:hypothetical protein [Caldilineaceae bacterium]